MDQRDKFYMNKIFMVNDGKNVIEKKLHLFHVLSNTLKIIMTWYTVLFSL